MKKNGPIGWVAWLLVVIGALNWGLVGINSNYDLVAIVLGSGTPAARGVYIVIGLAALVVIYYKTQCLKNKS